ncbi:triphosphoribosyl-dephospho-CoA synthase [Polystyrenella longa]|uniref:Triphosphoribosyl-dephospho-CoA synthase n=1 Tax=Polystyrenella longa TaxID=2528007 RepID=A0A518CMU2_9PLAN|nr:triphosphoribosyl-dephospho-CoA synthase [Polystyrenella longa]QDU80547.1 triphosphoribosyl-dephospho-CoA synthase [Polystyrenella longa]
MQPLSIADETFLMEAIRTACLLEATARKPGNVHAEADFENMCFEDFVKSANQTAPVLAKASMMGLGLIIEAALVATHSSVGKNTNLGMVLLIAPLAAVPMATPLQEGIASVLSHTTVEDAVRVYQAINLVQPGGMGKVSSQDLTEKPTKTLLEIMKLAADRDLIAAQYASHFELIFDFCFPLLEERADEFSSKWEEIIQTLFLKILAENPDSLIVRKTNMETAQEVSQRADDVLNTGWPATETSRELFTQFDRWLREDGNRRNPGTTADLVAAALFAGLREKIIDSPFQFRYSL